MNCVSERYICISVSSLTPVIWVALAVREEINGSGSRVLPKLLGLIKAPGEMFFLEVQL